MKTTFPYSPMKVSFKKKVQLRDLPLAENERAKRREFLAVLGACLLFVLILLVGIARLYNIYN